MTKLRQRWWLWQKGVTRWTWYFYVSLAFYPFWWAIMFSTGLDFTEVPGDANFRAGVTVQLLPIRLQVCISKDTPWENRVFTDTTRQHI